MTVFLHEIEMYDVSDEESLLAVAAAIATVVITLELNKHSLHRAEESLLFSRSHVA